MLCSPLGLTAAVLLAAVVVLAVVAPLIWQGRADAVQSAEILQGPSSAHPVGTDLLGRDILARVLVATRLSVALALLATGIGVTVGLLLGTAPVLLGRRVGRWIGALINIAVAFPSLLLALFFAVIFGVGAKGAVLAIGFATAPGFARLTQTMAATISGRDFIAAARVAGIGRMRILIRHVLPNIAEPLVVSATMAAGTALLSFASLSFLGLGVQAPSYDWGRLLGEGLAQIYVHPAGALAAGVAVVLAAMAFNLAGEAVARAIGLRSPGHRRRAEETPAPESPATGPEPEAPLHPLLAVENLRVSFPSGAGEVTPVRGVSLTMRPGEAIGIVGESGSGKSLTALAIAQLIERPGRVRADRLEFLGTDLTDEERRPEGNRRGAAAASDSTAAPQNEPSFDGERAAVVGSAGVGSVAGPQNESSFGRERHLEGGDGGAAAADSAVASQNEPSFGRERQLEGGERGAASADSPVASQNEPSFDGERAAVVGPAGTGSVADLQNEPSFGRERPAAVGSAGVGSAAGSQNESSFGDGGGRREGAGSGRSARRRLLGTSLAMVFQDPMTSLNPTHRVGRQLAEVVREHQRADRRTAWRRAVDRLSAVRITDAERRARQLPHEFSGGMRQRAMIGMGVMANPKLIIADEPTTALDVTVQRQVLQLLANIRAAEQVGLLFISHDVTVVGQVCDRVLVMYAGRVVEDLPTGALLHDARHPYTRALVAAVPDMTTDRSLPLAVIPGRPPDPYDMPAGCPYAPRCPLATDQCRSHDPALTSYAAGRRVACWHADLAPAAVADNHTDGEPENRTDEVLDDSVDEQTESRVDGAPENRMDEVPGNRTDEVPDDRIGEVPDDQIAAPLGGDRS
ncbi:dipeptide/oligopeptide/nickel ABC transporter permease/ATP-binding protein [Paractinoplanes ovalisporus]|uniref:dipeptide/oligopeptide/nickel ABC transporter permease/ATP-binding protein n=1 Tax=Paractinoplanes ovalisporus TaxID=2810368 RepID=UPI0027DC2FE0|nr:dipeptide/oligopeptide/nickel ABC transporter permease/ATP-binding protein [Actinoplanes ovalisporus]